MWRHRCDVLWVLCFAFVITRRAAIRLKSSSAEAAAPVEDNEGGVNRIKWTNLYLFKYLFVYFYNIKISYFCLSSRSTTECVVECDTLNIPWKGAFSFLWAVSMFVSVTGSSESTPRSFFFLQ